MKLRSAIMPWQNLTCCMTVMNYSHFTYFETKLLEWSNMIHEHHFVWLSLTYPLLQKRGEGRAGNGGAVGRSAYWRYQSHCLPPSMCFIQIQLPTPGSASVRGPEKISDWFESNDRLLVDTPCNPYSQFFWGKKWEKLKIKAGKAKKGQMNFSSLVHFFGWLM